MRKEVKAGESRAFEGRAGVTKAGRGQLSSCRLKSVLRPAPRKRTRGERACGRQEGPSRAVNLSLMKRANKTLELLRYMYEQPYFG